MARYLVQISSPLSPPDAFAYMADLNNFAEWDAGVRRVEQVDGDGAGPETSVDVTGAVGLGSLTLRYRTVEFDAPDRVVVEAKSTLLTSLDTITVEAVDGGSIVTYDSELKLNGLLGLGDPVLGLTFRRIGDRAIEGLITALEGERVVEAAA